MGLLEKTFIQTNKDYNQGFGLDCFRDRYSLRAGKQGDSKVFMRWVFPQKYDRESKESYPGDNAFPMAIELPEDSEDACEALMIMALAIAKEEDLDADAVYDHAKRSKGKGSSKSRRSEAPKKKAPPRPKWEDDDPGVSDDDIPF